MIKHEPSSSPESFSRARGHRRDDFDSGKNDGIYMRERHGGKVSYSAGPRDIREHSRSQAGNSERPGLYQYHSNEKMRRQRGDVQDARRDRSPHSSSNRDRHFKQEFSEVESGSRHRNFRGRNRRSDQTAHDSYQWGRREDNERSAVAKGANAVVPKEQRNMEVSGALLGDTNTFNGVVVGYSEPEEARKPKIRWRLYPFKGDESLPILYIHRQSAYIFGRDRRVADIPLDHPSCSKQHAALQYRLVSQQASEDTGGRSRRMVKPYVIDLDSANGTFLNNNRIVTKRYVELKEKDVVKFGFSSREYVLLNEHSSKSADNPSSSSNHDHK